MERPVLSEETIERNVQSIEATLCSLLTSQHGQEPLVVNNLAWFGQMKFLQFLREVGKYARVGTMLSKDSVKTRLESETGMSFTEFTYQLLQGYDFVHLRRQYGVEVQVVCLCGVVEREVVVVRIQTTLYAHIHTTFSHYSHNIDDTLSITEHQHTIDTPSRPHRLSHTISLRLVGVINGETL